MTELTLPYPPSANGLWRRAGKRIHLSTSYRKWLTAAGWAIKQQRPASIQGPYKLSLQAARPDRRKRDLGNLEKALSDLLVRHQIVRDDSDCEQISLRWVTTGEGVTVRVEPAGVE